MPSRKKIRHARFRVGRVSVYLHQVRRKVGANRDQAEQVAAQVNGQLSSGAPTLLAFDPIGVPDLRPRFLDYHEHVLRSSLATIRRYRAATKHLADFAATQPHGLQAHALGAEAFAAYLRQIEVAPNGHPNAKKRTLRDKGVQFILETCRAMYAYAGKHRHLPPYVGNPFGELPLDRLKIQDAKPVFVFDADSELAFLKARMASRVCVTKRNDRGSGKSSANPETMPNFLSNSRKANNPASLTIRPPAKSTCTSC